MTKEASRAEALAAALSVAVPEMLMSDAVKLAGGMIDHLHNQGFDVVRVLPGVLKPDDPKHPRQQVGRIVNVTGEARAKAAAETS